jgi:hypothetical protein
MFAASDARLKDNIRPVGKTYDGQNIYSYDFGDGATRMGLMAQEVLKRDPEAVGHRDGYLTLDYDRATQGAEGRSMGGVAPRMGYQEGGTRNATEAELAVHPADEIYEKRVIPQESGGRQFDRFGRPLTSPAGAIGIAQVMPRTAPEAARLAGLEYDENRYMNDPDYNKALGRAYFRAQYDRFNDPALAMAAYNAGPGRVNQALERARESGGDWRSFLPAETQRYIGMSSAGQKAPSGVVPRERPSYYDYVPTRVNQKGEEEVNLKQMLIPTLVGLGAMASSPSRYFGAAALQGLGAGAQAYANLEKQQADIGETKAREVSTLSGIPASALIGEVGPDGKISYRIRPEYFKGQLAGQPPGATGAPKTGLEVAQEKAIEAGQQAVSGAPQKTDPIKTDVSGGTYNFSVNPQQQTEKDFQDNFAGLGYRGGSNASYVIPALIGSQPALAAKAAKDQEEAQKRVEIASMVPRQRLETNMMTDAVFGISPTGVAGQGPGQSDRARALAVYDWAVRFAGLPGLSPDDRQNQNISSAEIIQKLRQQMGPMQAGQYGFHGQALAQAINDAQISGSLTPQASTKLAASMYVLQQMPEDFARYYDAYVKRYGTALNVQQNFNREMGQRYETEKKMIEQAIMPYKRKTADGKEEYTSYVLELRKNPALAKRFDQEFKTPGLARMFLGG